jgi:hypothetical protein
MRCIKLLQSLLVSVGLRHPPDDPWILANRHRYGHHYSPGMHPGSMDHLQQESAHVAARHRELLVQQAHTH